MTEIVAKIEPLVPGYGERLAVLPGVTGLAQIQLPPDTNVESVRRKIRYDAYYAANRTLWPLILSRFVSPSMM